MNRVITTSSGLIRYELALWGSNTAKYYQYRKQIRLKSRAVLLPDRRKFSLADNEKIVNHTTKQLPTNVSLP